jgi:hypothetical protein
MEFAPAAQLGAMEIAVLDLGSVTFHLQHIRVDDPAQLTTSLDEKRLICLGAQVFAPKAAQLIDLLGVEPARLCATPRKRSPDHARRVVTRSSRGIGSRFAASPLWLWFGLA